jgi:hypothetical protein
MLVSLAIGAVLLVPSLVALLVLAGRGDLPSLPAEPDEVDEKLRG